MAAILKLRRGSTTPTSLEQSELFYNSALATLQVGKSSATNDNITLVKLTETNTGNLQIVGTISGSYLTLNNDITASNAYFRGDVRLDGQIILGDVPQDNINVNAQFSGSLIPSASTFDLGSTTKKWNNVYANNLNGSVTDSNLLNFTSSINTFTSSEESKNSTLATYTGSNNTKWTTLGTYTGSVDSKFITLGTYTGSIDTKFTTLGTYTGSIDTKFSTLETYTASVDSDLSSLYSTASNHENRIVYLSGSFSQSVDDRLDQLEINSGSVNNSVSLFNAFTSSQNTKNSTLETYTSSVDLQLTELYSTASNHETRIDGIQDYTSSLRTAIGVNGTNVTINGDLSVLGTTTQINSTQVNIGENILELNYGGSATTAGIITKDATGGSTISGSLLWDATNDYWKAGKLANESKILLAGGDSVVSGSAQISLVDTADYVSAIKNRLNIESVISSSVQVDVYNTTNFTSYSSSVDSRLIVLTNDGVSQDGRLDNLELFSGSEITKNSTLATYTGSNDTKWNTLENVTSSLINATASYETRGNNIVSGSSQLTASYDLRYADSSSFHNLVGEWDYGMQGSIRDAAFYSVTSSADIVLVSGSINYNNNHLLTAGATKKYIDWRTDEILTAIGAADITAVVAGNGIIGGGVTGDVTMSLDTGSTHFTDAIKTKLNTDGVISGSSQIVSILEPLNTFSSSQESKDSTLATYTGSVNNQLTELYTTASNHEVRIDNLESWSSSLDTTFVTETELTNLSESIDSRLDNLELFSGSQITKNSTLATYTGSVDTNLSSLNSFSSSIDTTIKTKLNVEGVLSGSSQIVSILGPLNTFSASQETKDSTLASYTASVDSSLSQLNAVSHSHSNKTQLDTINQNLANTSDVTFGSIHTSGTGSIGTNLVVYGDLTVFGTQSIINSENLAVSDNMIYLNNNSEVTNPDLGIVGNYNDGTYAHTGIFSDASDSQTWKVFKGYTIEPSGSIDTSHASFALADFKAANITATSFNGVINATNGVLSGSLQAQLPAGVVSGSSQVILSSTTGGGTSDNVQFGSLGIGMAASGTSGRIDATNDIVAYSSSDRRFKENITPIENALDKINQIGGYEFDWKEENKIEHGYEGHDLGVIAQEIEAIAPELVQTRENGYKAVKYDKLVSVLIQAVKELSAKVTELENK